MSIISLASSASVWRGYEYYKNGYVLLCNKVSEHEFRAKVRGSGRNYDVFIDIDHPRKSKCNCPHADGTKRICKHMVALYFKMFPGEAADYIREVEEREMEEEERQQELEDKLVNYINSLSKEELKDALYDVLCDSPEWVLERFIYERVEW